MTDITITRELAVDLIVNNMSNSSVCKYVEDECGATDLHSAERLKNYLLTEVSDNDIEELLMQASK